jgi:Protein of unknown function (DUF4065)
MSPDEKRVRLIEAAAALLDAAPRRRLNTVSLNKGLFYLDLASLRDFGETFTNNTYIALPQGPVVAKYPARLIKPLQEEGIAEQKSEGLANPVLLLKLPRFAWITSDVRKIAQNVARWCSDKSSVEVSEFSHRNPGWLIAREDEAQANGKKQVIDMYIAMQQILDDDPWLSDPITKASLAACNLADSRKGQPW